MVIVQKPLLSFWKFKYQIKNNNYYGKKMGRWVEDLGHELALYLNEAICPADSLNTVSEQKTPGV